MQTRTQTQTRTQSRAARQGRPDTGRYVEQVMGMPISLALRGRHVRDAEAQAAWSRVVTELRWVNLVFSTWNPRSVISRYGRGELRLEDCPPEVAEVIALGERAEVESEGAFSINRSGVFDPTGVVKGWAVERAARHLHALAATNFCLSAGGDLLCHSRTEDGEPWLIGIEDPADPGRIIARVPLYSGAVATSGTAHRGEHLTDARTGASPTGLRSVSVICPSLTWADIDATAAYALGSEAAAAWLTDRGRDFLIVYADGATQTR